MRKNNLLWISLVALLVTSAVMVSTVVSPVATIVYLHPTKTEGIEPPNSFDVSVMIDIEEPDTGVYGWEFTVEFDPGILEVASHVENKTDYADGIGDGTQTIFQTDYWPVVPFDPDFPWYEGVYVNVTIMLTEGVDYTIDYPTGTITFTTAPDPGAAITVKYRYEALVYHVTNGGFLEEIGWATAWAAGLVAPSVNNMNGSVTVGNGFMPDEYTNELPAVGALGIEKVLATIEFNVIDWGVCPLDLMNVELDTALGSPPYQTVVVIDPNTYTVEGGVFDNRLEKKNPTALFDVLHFGMVWPVVDRLITFDASASNDDLDGGWIVSYFWDFGDGTNDTGMIVDHVFAEVGAYTVGLTVTDNDDLTGNASTTVDVVEWMEGGEFPDLVGECAWPERRTWQENPRGRELKLFGSVGNPTEDDFEVYVEFTIIDKETAGMLGKIQSETVTIHATETLELYAIMDLTDTRWSVAPDAGNWFEGNLIWARYTAFAKCYHNVTSGFEEGYVTKDFGYTVKPAKADIAILEVTTNAVPNITQGDLLEIYVNVTNEGSCKRPVAFNITVTYMGITTPTTELEVRPVVLYGDDPLSIIETFSLDTTGMTTEGYLVMVELTTLTYEINTADNSATCTFVIV